MIPYFYWWNTVNLPRTRWGLTFGWDAISFSWGFPLLWAVFWKDGRLHAGPIRFARHDGGERV